MKKNILYAVIVLLFVIISSGITYLFIDGLYSNNTTNNKINDIIKYELKTSEYFREKPDVDNYVIRTKEELNDFYSLYSNKLNIDESYLENNVIFIRTMEETSGSVSVKLTDITFDNNTVNFIVDVNEPEFGTDDMAFWYLVGIIPKDKLENINLNNWYNPTEILNNN